MITAQRIAKAAIKHLTRAGIGMRAALGARRRFTCPACGGQVVDFFRYGACARWGCPECGASPRERLVNYLVETGRLSIPSDGTMVHIAPNEGSLVRRFTRVAGTYIPADLDPARYKVPGMRAIDLMDMGLTGQLDLFYASHVMEHVPDDGRVLRNIFAALRPGGEAWLIVPIWDSPTEDGPPDLSARTRERRFGQWDHVRQYGMDFADRIRAAGFTVDLVRAGDMPAEARLGMALDDLLFRAVKPLTAA